MCACKKAHFWARICEPVGSVLFCFAFVCFALAFVADAMCLLKIVFLNRMGSRSSRCLAAALAV